MQNAGTTRIFLSLRRPVLILLLALIGVGFYAGQQQRRADDTEAAAQENAYTMKVMQARIADLEAHQKLYQNSQKCLENAVYKYEHHQQETPEEKLRRITCPDPRYLPHFCSMSGSLPSSHP